MTTKKTIINNSMPNFLKKNDNLSYHTDGMNFLFMTCHLGKSFAAKQSCHHHHQSYIIDGRLNESIFETTYLSCRQ